MHSAPLPEDALMRLATPSEQQHAAALAREAFTTAFRQAAGEDACGETLGDVEERCGAWSAAALTPEAAALRLAMLLTGLDQWGLAFSQAFGITTIPSLTRLIGNLRTRIDTTQDAHLQRQIERLEAAEGNAIDFKITLRRDIHLALWHAMASGLDLESVQPILQTLGSLLVALDARMPTLGWRLVADTLAHVQIQLLKGEHSSIAQDGTRQLLQALEQTMPRDHYQTIMAHSTSVLMEWTRAQHPH